MCNSQLLIDYQVVSQSWCKWCLIMCCLGTISSQTAKWFPACVFPMWEVIRCKQIKTARSFVIIHGMLTWNSLVKEITWSRESACPVLNGSCSGDGNFNCIFSYQHCSVFIEILLKFFSRDPSIWPLLLLQNISIDNPDDCMHPFWHNYPTVLLMEHMWQMIQQVKDPLYIPWK